MPVITIATVPHPAEHELLRGVADAVADALSLAPGDVIAMSIPVRTTVANGATTDAEAKPWALISIHGSDRGAANMERASAAARRAAADWSGPQAAGGGADLEGVWCEWLLPQHP